MSITTLPNPPSRKRPATFSDETDSFLSSLPRFVEEVNGLTTEYEQNAATIAENTPMVLAAAEFKGLWSVLTGALAIPSTVYHIGAYWMLAESVTDVTVEVPGTSIKWLPIITSSDAFNFQHGII